MEVILEGVGQVREGPTWVASKAEAPMERRLFREEKLVVVRLVRPLKASAGIVSRLVGKVMDVRAVPKVSLLIEEEGRRVARLRLRVLRRGFFAKAPLPREVTVAGRVREGMEVAAKAESAMEVRAVRAAKLMVVREVTFLKASAGMVAVLVGRWRVIRWLPKTFLVTEEVRAREERLTIVGLLVLKMKAESPISVRRVVAAVRLRVLLLQGML
jgi:hypothetical protein